VRTSGGGGGGPADDLSGEGDCRTDDPLLFSSDGGTAEPAAPATAEVELAAPVAIREPEPRPLLPPMFMPAVDVFRGTAARFRRVFVRREPEEGILDEKVGRRRGRGGGAGGVGEGAMGDVHCRAGDGSAAPRGAKKGRRRGPVPGVGPTPRQLTVRAEPQREWHSCHFRCTGVDKTLFLFFFPSHSAQ
jgi:hypothetical protein